ncbi:Alpha/Beta hydrolase protein [Pisolithus orientalis]|uniref:Alpha/Beta hydrolase protein n=1 Tax=Pisolithus orientalis TaxID=936130 RepID=UPI0022252030|nr:Alpha/Beta hydrolase protein [Pisolithus orientalis]KAI6030939.1 Alpha/Beta hydrolase protein [Pisolithus orientalis]
MYLLSPLILPFSISSRVSHMECRQSNVYVLSPSELASLAPYSQFARAAYCPPSTVDGWMCGEACDAVPDFLVSLTGGDGSDTQYYYVGYWLSGDTVIVAHQGTDTTKLLAYLTDVDIFLESLDPLLFPGISSSVQVHSGFANEHAKTAPTILAGVGHSLGGALAELDCLFLALSLPSNIAIKGVTYGTPRVGNPAWASFFDSTDPIPIVPGIFMGFSHVHGEVHITEPNYAVSCPGNDDATDANCTIMTVPNVFDSNMLNHLGPYQGIYIGSLFCT